MGLWPRSPQPLSIMQQQSQTPSSARAVAGAYHTVVAVGGKKVCSQPVPQLSPFLHQAFSAFFYTVDFIQTVMGRPVLLPSDLKDAAEMICATNWSEVGSLGMVGWRGLLHVGHHPGTESSPWRELGVLAPME